MSSTMFTNPSINLSAFIRWQLIGLIMLQVCVIGNLCPETVEEARALVPSITVIQRTTYFVFAQEIRQGWKISGSIKP